MPTPSGFSGFNRRKGQRRKDEMTPAQREETEHLLGVPLDPPSASRVAFWIGVALVVAALLATFAHARDWFQ